MSDPDDEEFRRMEIGGPIYKAGGKIKDQYGKECWLTARQLRAMVPEILRVKTVLYQHDRGNNHIGEIIRAHVDDTDTLHIDASLFPPITCGMAPMLKKRILAGDLRSWSFAWNEHQITGEPMFVEASVVKRPHFREGKITRIKCSEEGGAQTVTFVPLSTFAVRQPSDSISRNFFSRGIAKTRMATNDATVPAPVVVASGAAPDFTEDLKMTPEILAELVAYRGETALKAKREYDATKRSIMDPAILGQIYECASEPVIPQPVASRLRAAWQGSSIGFSKDNAHSKNDKAVSMGLTPAIEQDVETRATEMVTDICAFVERKDARRLLDFALDRAREVMRLREINDEHESRAQATNKAANIHNTLDQMTTTWMERQIRKERDNTTDTVTFGAKRAAEDPPQPTGPSQLRATASGQPPAKKARPTTGPAGIHDFFPNIIACLEDPSNYHPPGAPIPEDMQKFKWSTTEANRGELPCFTSGRM